MKKEDFEQWIEETFYGRDTDFKIEPIPHANILNYDQAIQLATHIWKCMQNQRPPWWSRYEGLERRLTLATALTDTGSAEFRSAFPTLSVGGHYLPRDSVPGWRVVDAIRAALMGENL